ncbi:MAG: phosphatidylglycerol lysyltransferase domain-containing protein [Treponema sp.]|nr:phosphatidylglycerol lysyltransferase domain-containing protein [Treponema sp.]
MSHTGPLGEGRRPLNEGDRRARDYLLDRGFLPAGHESYPLFRDFKGVSVLSELTPAVSTFWTLSFNELYRFIDGCLVTVFFFEGMEPYVELKQPEGFYGDRLRGLIEILYELVRGAGLSVLRIYAVEERFLEQFTGVPGFTVKAGYSDDHSEYVYKPADIVNLSGGINHKKHTHLNKFLDRSDITLVPMNNDNRRLFLDVEREWCASQDCALCSAFAGCELRALEIMGLIYDDRYFRGLLAYADGRLSGYLVWEQREQGRAYLHFGKGTIQNLFVYLIYLLARDELGGGDSGVLNINEDMGKEGLRRFKRHLGLYEQWRKYLCVYEKDGSR